jgi:hypothetical protein
MFFFLPIKKFSQKLSYVESSKMCMKFFQSNEKIKKEAHSAVSQFFKKTDLCFFFPIFRYNIDRHKHKLKRPNMVQHVGPAIDGLSIGSASMRVNNPPETANSRVGYFF